MTKTASTKLENAFGAARSNLRTMRLMMETIFQGSGDDYCALLTMLDYTLREVNDAQAVADTLLEDRKC